MTDFKQLCAELLAALEEEASNWNLAPECHPLVVRAQAALAEPEPQRRCIYSPVQIAECGGPCQQGPEHCDCGELWVTEPEDPTDEEIMELMPQQMRDDLAAAARALSGFDLDNTKAASFFRIILNRHSVDHARAVLARWGNHPGSPDSSTQPS